MFRRLFSLTLTFVYLVVLIVVPVFASSCRPRQDANEFSRTNREAAVPELCRYPRRSIRHGSFPIRAAKLVGILARSA